jgi:hypothetical protein
MSMQLAVRRAAISVWLLIFLIGFTASGSAAPIELENDVDISWSDTPCVPSSGPSPPHAQPLCDFVDGEWRLKPEEELIRIVGAPRLVPNASNAGDLLDISVDFLDVSLDHFLGIPGNATPLILNVFDLHLNPVLRPGEAAPLQLTYFIPPSGGLTVPASDVFLKLKDFDDFGLLPVGDLIFNVMFHPRLSITDASLDRPDHVAVVTLSGAGTTEAPEVVPEPGTLFLLLSGAAITGLGARRRRSGHRHPIG